MSGVDIQWGKLLSDRRLRNPNAEDPEDRTRFQQDLDRIVFSAAFRRLAHKTQVHPLSENDHVHTRLTHSIEVASVGRSLGNIVDRKICDGNGPDSTVADIVQAACLAHDIGNPPFGHSGEKSISRYFEINLDKERKFGIDGVDLNEQEQDDLKNFEGNAQGFRILTQLENHKFSGGLQLTEAVLGAYTKYPRSSGAEHDDEEYEGWKKNGFYHTEKQYFEEISKSMGLESVGEKGWIRHPLAYLVEAADDICYAIIDVEDGFELGYLAYADAKKVLEPMARLTKSSDNLSERERIAKLRAYAIGNLTKAAGKAFLDNWKIINEGIRFETDLISETEHSDHIAVAKNLVRDKIFYSERKSKLEYAGGEVLGGLLRAFVPMSLSLRRVEFKVDELDDRNSKLARIISKEWFNGEDSDYGVIARVNDFIAGMTDRFALDLYRSLKGIDF